MTAGIRIRDVVSIAGVVREKRTPKNHEEPPRITGALVRIIVPKAPAKVQSKVSAMLDTLYTNSFTIELKDFVAELDKGQLTEALRTQFEAHGKILSRKKNGEPEEEAHAVPMEQGSTWQIVDRGKSYMIWHLNDMLTVYFALRHRAGMAPQRLRQRVDLTRTQADGIFYFANLPEGLYHLRVSAPEMGSRYGAVEVGPVDVQEAPAEGPFPVARADVDLPPTRVHGVVTDAGTGKPIPAARVRLLGDTTAVKTGDDGAYDLNRLIAGKPTLEVTASGFKPVTHQVDLAAGQERVEDLALQPVNEAT